MKNVLYQARLLWNIAADHRIVCSVALLQLLLPYVSKDRLLSSHCAARHRMHHCVYVWSFLDTTV